MANIKLIVELNLETLTIAVGDREALVETREDVIIIWKKALK